MSQYEINDDIPKYWDDRYKAWLTGPDWGVFDRKDIWFETRLSHLLPLPDKPAGRVLDYGCGNAMYGVPLLRRFTKYVGFDTSETAIQIARQYYQNNQPELLDRIYLEHYLGRPGEWEVDKSETYDCAYTLTVLQHQPVFYRKLMIENIKRLLKPTGLYVGCEMIGATQAYDMPSMGEDEWRAAWAPWVLDFDKHPNHPEWWDDNVWSARLPKNA